MPPAEKDLLPLNRLDAEIQEKEHYTTVKHWLSGQQANPDNHITWKRTYKTLGEGGFGLVFREECIQGFQKGSVRAVKKIEKPNAYKTTGIDYGRELEAIARFSKPKFARFFVQSSGWYESDTAVYIAMELVPHGSLQQYIGDGLPEKDVQILVFQLLQGLSHMHAAGYAHRDLKPPNLLVAQQGPTWHIKIADFGLSKGIASRMSSFRTIAGTAGYVAPELLGLAHDDDADDDDASPPFSYSNAVDIWAVGVIAFVLLVGDLPFDPTDFRHLRRYVKGKVGFPERFLRDRNVSALGLSFIASQTIPAPSNRPSVSSSLNHQWFRAICDRPTRPTKPTALRAGVSGTIPISQVSSRDETLATWTTKDSGYETTTLKATEIATRSMEVKQGEGDGEKALHDSGIDRQTVLYRQSAICDAEVLLRRTTRVEPCPTREFAELSWHLIHMSPFAKARLANLEYYDSERVRGILLSSGGQYLAIYGIGKDVSGLSDGTRSAILDLSARRIICRIQLKKARKWTVPAISPDGHLVAHTEIHLKDAYNPWLVSCSYKILVHQTVTGKLLRRISLTTGAKPDMVFEIAFSANAQRLICVFHGRQAQDSNGLDVPVVRSWNIATWEEAPGLDLRASLHRVAFSANGRFLVGYVATGPKHALMELWNAETWAPVSILNVTRSQSELPAQLHVSCDGALVLINYRQGNVWIAYDTSTRREIRKSQLTDDLLDDMFLSQCLISPDGRHCATLQAKKHRPGSHEVKVCVWNWYTGITLIDERLGGPNEEEIEKRPIGSRPKHNLNEPSKPHAIAFAPDSSLFRVLHGESLYTWQLV